MSPKGNETFKNYLELEIPKKKTYFLKVCLSTQKGSSEYLARSYQF